MKEFKKNKERRFICEICKKDFINLSILTIHINKCHCLKFDYYKKYIFENNEGICLNCGKNVNMLGKRIRKFCSKSCAASYNNILCINSFKSREKANKTIRNNANDKNKNKKILEKRKQYNFNKYGVEFPLQNEIFFNKQQKTALKLKQFKNTDIYYQASNELDFLEKNYNKYPDIQRGPIIKYIFEGKNKVYHPDFYIPSLNLIIECKNSYLAQKDKEKIEAKEKATIASGFKYIMIIDKNYN